MIYIDKTAFCHKRSSYRAWFEEFSDSPLPGIDRGQAEWASPFTPYQLQGVRRCPSSRSTRGPKTRTYGGDCSSDKNKWACLSSIVGGRRTGTPPCRLSLIAIGGARRALFVDGRDGPAALFALRCITSLAVTPRKHLPRDANETIIFQSVQIAQPIHRSASVKNVIENCSARKYWFIHVEF